MNVYIHQQIYIVLALVFLFAGCTNSTEESTEQAAVDAFENVVAISQEDGVLLRWENLPVEAFDQVEIVFTVGGERRVQQLPRNEKQGNFKVKLEDAAVYTFQLRAFNSARQQFSKEAMIRGRRLTAADPGEALQQLIESISMGNGDRSAYISWENPAGIEATIHVRYDDQQLELPAAGVARVHNISDLDAERAYPFEIHVDYDGIVRSDTKVHTVVPSLKVGRLIPEGWTITASSEERSNSEQAPATNLLDGDPKTYWRSRISSPVARYPHYVIIDLQRNRNLRGLTLSRRSGDSDNSSWDHHISFSTDGVTFTDKYMYYNSQTDPFFKIEFNRNVEGEQMYLFPRVHTARYVRVDMTRGGKTHAFYGDIHLYGE